MSEHSEKMLGLETKKVGWRHTIEILFKCSM